MANEPAPVPPSPTSTPPNRALTAGLVVLCLAGTYFLVGGVIFAAAAAADRRGGRAWWVGVLGLPLLAVAVWQRLRARPGVRPLAAAAVALAVSGIAGLLVIGIVLHTSIDLVSNR